jgi:putative transposase
MVGDPALYRWSSYRHNGLGQADSVLTPHSLYQALGKSQESRQSAYQALFRFELDEESIADIWQALVQGRTLGSEKFEDEISAATGVRCTRPQRGRPEKFLANAGPEVQTDFGF